MPLTIEDKSTIHMALCAWIGRCESEAKIMENWAAEYALRSEATTADQCLRNAAASREFAAKASALLASDKL